MFVVSWQAGLFDWPTADISKAIATVAMVGTAALKALHFWRKLRIVES